MSRKSRDSGVDPNAWLATYSDTITLLLTFFVLLYSFSTVDANKFRSIADALQNVLQGNPSRSVLQLNMNDGEVPMVGTPIPMTVTPSAYGEADMYENMKELIEENDLEGLIDIKEDSRGFIFEIKDKILFESGKAELISGSKPVLEVITQYLNSINNGIIIEGHTDNVPIHNKQYYDNWDLSTARANNVARYFINSQNVNPKRIRTMGYGEYRPIVENSSSENRAMNRRVNILILTDSVEEDGDSNE